MSIWPVLLILVVAGYLLGAIPFCFVIGKLYGVDLRVIGSGNVGATNLRRGLVGKPFGGPMSAVGLVLDSMKGFASAFWLPALAVGLLHPSEPYGLSVEWLPICAGVAAVLGHTFSVFLHFKGGKGVATGAGMFFAFCWQSGLAGVVVFVVVFAIWKISSLASLAGAASVPVGSCVYYHYTTGMSGHWPVVGMQVCVVAFVFVRHRANIGRLMRGEEPTLRASKAAAAAAAAATPANGAAVAGGENQVERHAH